MAADGLCQHLEWDSRFFGCSIARIDAERYTGEVMARAVEWCQAQSIACAYLLCNADDVDGVGLAEDNGFRFVDVRMTLEMRLGPNTIARRPAERVHIRPCTPSDIPDLRAIARVSHRDSRFYCDPNFPAARCDHLYETWIERSCCGYADAVLVADTRGRCVGYISCHLQGEREGKIGLVAVAEGEQGRGLGGALLHQSLRWFAERNAQLVTVVTQARNVRAQRLYQKAGFLTRSVELWCHRWFVNDSPAP